MANVRVTLLPVLSAGISNVCVTVTLSPSPMDGALTLPPISTGHCVCPAGRQSP